MNSKFLVCVMLTLENNFELCRRSFLLYIVSISERKVLHEHPLTKVIMDGLDALLKGWRNCYHYLEHLQ